MEGPAQWELMQEQGTGEVSRRNMLIMVVVYLVVASVKDLDPLASRIICWASTWNRPALSAVVIVCLVWTWRGQAQRLWARAHALVLRHALCLSPAIRATTSSTDI